jgi:uncharacterized protein YjlB
MAGTEIFADARVRALTFTDDGRFPNSRLPLLIYGEAVARAKASPEAMEKLLSKGGWPPLWRATIFTNHHFHSTAHEVLGIGSGSARVMMGGPQGDELDVAAGDVIVIPAGVGHKRLSSSADFLVVGGYPPGQDWDLLRGEPGERPMADENIARVAMPETDPVFGAKGPLIELWQRG